MSSRSVGRRRVLRLLGGGVLLGGSAAAVGRLAGGALDPRTAVTSDSPPVSRRPTRARRRPAPARHHPRPRRRRRTPPPPPYEPLPGEYLPNAKRLAAAVAAALTTYDVGTQPGDVAGRAIAGDLVPGGAPPASALATPKGLDELAAAVARLVDPGATSVGEVVYPQCGGDTPKR